MTEESFAPSPSASSGQLAPVNILLVDDESRNLDVLESCLQPSGYNLVRALTAERALLLLLEGEFAAMVLDIQMPDMTGFELANLIKQRKRTQHIPIIFLTAYFQGDKDVLEGYGTGAVDYLTKPVNPQILRSKIAVFVDLFRKTQALAATNAALELEIAHRHKAEESLRMINTGLETRVQTRTIDLVRANEELRLHAQALWAREAQLRLVTDHAPIFITQFDRSHRFKFVNRTYARSFGLEPEQVVGKHFTEVMGDAPYAAIKHHLDAALDGQRVEFEAEIPYAGLGARWVFVIHEPERSAEGQVIGLVAVTTDITERKQAEQAVATARDLALAASRTKDDFLARLSHELRTPLNPVLLLASEAAANPKLSPEVRADFETIAQNVMLEARLIDDLLDLTAISRGKIALKMRPLDIHVLVEESLAMLRQDFSQKNIALTLNPAAAKHMVVGDDMRLKQIFWNVIKNAVKFTPAGGRIEVTTSLGWQNKSIVITVADSGLGMTPEEITRIFAAFAQGDHAAQAGGQFGGLGLGLVISQALVQLHQGRIGATSEGRDHGSQFSIELPLAHGDSASPLVPETTKFAVQPKIAARRFRLLLVEDHKPTARTLADLLARRNFEVVTALTLAEAREKVGQEKFDFVISDIGLPDGTGHELMTELRNVHGLTGIALTGYGMDEDMNRSRETGFIAHLTKPVNVQDLDRALALITAEKT